MNKQSVWKRVLSLMLAVTMSVGNIPTTAFAEDVSAGYEEETELTTEAAAEAPEETEETGSIFGRCRSRSVKRRLMQMSYWRIHPSAGSTQEFTEERKAASRSGTLGVPTGPL